MRLKINDNPNKELGEALLESGPLAAGALPGVGGASEAGSRAVLEDKMEEILKEAGDARKFSISLAHLEYSDDLVTQMKKHSVKLETIYAKLQDLRKRGVKNNASYEKFYGIYEAMSQWYKRTVAAKALQSGLKKKKSKKNKKGEKDTPAK
ncbi:unnamed protein product, partial [Symbiodinium necroappetens]